MSHDDSTNLSYILICLVIKPHVSHLSIILADGKVAYVSSRNSIKGRPDLA
jgi:hypothetical protein